MSKMGQELEKRLDENKYELFEVCGQAYDALTDKDDPHGILREWLKQVLARVWG